MLKFNEYLKEETEEVIQIDARYLQNNVDSLNIDLDNLTEKPYQNAPIFLAQLRGTLERYGMILPQSATPYFMNLTTELVYALGDSGLYLYIIYDTNDDGFVDGYAQAVTSEELSALVDMPEDEILNLDREPVRMRPSTWYAKRDDDSGNDSEY